MTKILVIDSDDFTLAKWLPAFQNAEIQTTLTFDAVLGWEVYQKMRQQFELVQMDIMLPGGCAFKLIREIRKLDRAIPVLVVTNRFMQEDYDLAIQAGATAYLLKPIRVDDVIAEIHKLTIRI